MDTKATQTHFGGIRPSSQASQFSQSDPSVVPILSTAWKATCWFQYSGASGKRWATYIGSSNLSVVFSAGGNGVRRCIFWTTSEVDAQGIHRGYSVTDSIPIALCDGSRQLLVD
jgi:hypothetical protein